MGFFGKSSEGCGGKHDQRMHERTEPDKSKSIVVDCNNCGREWKYDSKSLKRK